MENIPVMMLVAWKFFNQEDQIRFGQWASEVFMPVWVKNPFLAGINRYQIIKENPGYCNFISTFHYANAKSLINHWKDQESVNVVKDMATTWGGKREILWNYGYMLDRSISNLELAEATKKELKSDDGPSIHYRRL